MAPMPPPSCQGRSGKQERNVINGDRRPGNQGRGDDPSGEGACTGVVNTLRRAHCQHSAHSVDTLYILSTLCTLSQRCAHSVNTLYILSTPSYILSTLCTHCQHSAHSVNTVHTLSTLRTLCQHCAHSVNTVHTLYTLCQHFAHSVIPLRRAHCQHSAHSVDTLYTLINTLPQ